MHLTRGVCCASRAQRMDYYDGNADDGRIDVPASKTNIAARDSREYTHSRRKSDVGRAHVEFI